MSFPPPGNYGGPGPQGFPGPQGPTRGPQPHFPPPQFGGPPPGHFAGPGGPPGPYPNQYAPQPHYPPQHFQGPPPHMNHGPPHPQHHPGPPPMMQPPPPQPAGVPYIGARISLISNMDIRYEGILYTIDAANSTVALQHVRCFGTEDRSTEFVPASSNIYEYIVFSGKDIKDLHVVTSTPANIQQPPHDPAIVSTQAPPTKEPTPEKSDKPQPAPASAPAPATAPPKSPKAAGAAPTSSSTSTFAPAPKSTSAPSDKTSDKPSDKPDDGMIHIYPAKHDSTPGMGSYLRSRAGHGAVTKAEAYDFDKANQEFEKLRIKEHKTSDEPAGHASGGVAVDEGPSSDSMAQYQLPVADDKPVVAQPKYDKSKSFFDDLTSDRDIDTSMDRRKQRGQDAETFGDAALGYRSRGGHRGGHGHGHGHGYGGPQRGGQGGGYNRGGDRGGNWRQGGQGGGDRRDNYRDNRDNRDNRRDGGGRDNYQRRDNRDAPRERTDGAGPSVGSRGGRGRRGGGGYQAGSATVSQ